METSIIIFIIFSVMMFILAFMVPGGLLYYASSSSPNNLLGFRTKRAFLSKETWVYANKQAGGLFIKLGLVYILLISIILSLVIIANIHDTLGEMYVIIPVVLPIIPILFIIIKVQNGLKKNFDSNGNKINGK